MGSEKKFIKAVVITGGEPTLYGNDLIELINSIKKLGFKIKLDTNGTNPKLLKNIISLKLVDYFAMDIKNTFEKYDETTASKVNIDAIKESIKLIETSDIEYEFRCTINKSMHTEEDIIEMKSYIKDPKRFFLQNYQYNKEQIENKDFGGYTEEELKNLSSSSKTEVKI
jgi:pyruvate formate lyase activating enzyme